VSTVDQNLALQRDALTEAGCAKIFTEQMSDAVIHATMEFKVRRLRVPNSKERRNIRISRCQIAKSPRAS
jgi:hypothetical protein